MWNIIFGSVILGMIVGFIYLVTRFRKFNFIDKISKGKGIVKVIISLIIVIALTVVISLIFGVMNAIVCVIHLMFVWLVSDLVFFIIKKVRKTDFNCYYAGMCAIIVTAVYLVCGWILANNVWETRYDISTDKDIGSIRIAQFADSHIGATFDGEEFNRYIDEIQSTKPDVVLITGDFVDDGTDKENMVSACKALGKLNTKYGVYYSFGNHDKGYYSETVRGYNSDDLVNELRKNNVTVLQDEAVLVDNRFYIIGRNDRSQTSRATMKTLTENLDKSKYIIVMDHQPNDYDNEKKANVDLVLSGHTHGGQLLPFNYVGEWIGANDKTYGLSKYDNTNFVVTSGISDWEMEFKTGCKSEYVVIDVKGK